MKKRFTVSKRVQVVVTESALGNQGALTLYYILLLRHTIRLLVTTMVNRLRIREIIREKPMKQATDIVHFAFQLRLWICGSICTRKQWVRTPQVKL